MCVDIQNLLVRKLRGKLVNAGRISILLNPDGGFIEISLALVLRFKLITIFSGNHIFNNLLERADNLKLGISKTMFKINFNSKVSIRSK